MRKDPLERIAEQNEGHSDEGWDEEPSGFSFTSHVEEENSPCVRVLEGHSKSITALYYEDGCLVGSFRVEPSPLITADITSTSRSPDHPIKPFDNGTWPQDNVSSQWISSGRFQTLQPLLRQRRNHLNFPIDLRPPFPQFTTTTSSPLPEDLYWVCSDPTFSQQLRVNNSQFPPLCIPMAVGRCILIL